MFTILTAIAFPLSCICRFAGMLEGDAGSLLNI